MLPLYPPIAAENQMQAIGSSNAIASRATSGPLP